MDVCRCVDQRYVTQTSPHSPFMWKKNSNANNTRLPAVYRINFQSVSTPNKYEHVMQNKTEKILYFFSWNQNQCVYFTQMNWIHMWFWSLDRNILQCIILIISQTSQYMYIKKIVYQQFSKYYKLFFTCVRVCTWHTKRYE